MKFTHDSLPETTEDLADAETRMRLALNAVGSQNSSQRRSADHQPRARHQFVRDGEVPVVVLNSRKEHTGPVSSGPSQMSRLETELYSERAAREKADRLLQQVNARAQAVQTQLTHAKMGQVEANASLTEAREKLEASTQEVRQMRILIERMRREHADEVQELRAALDKAREDRAEARAKRRQEILDSKPRAKTAIAVEADHEPLEPNADGSEPVQWWIPGWKDQYKNRYANKSSES